MADIIQTYSIDDAKFYPMTSVGPPPVYSDGIDIGCVNEVTLEESLTEAQARGDDAICVRVTRIAELTGTVKSTGLNMELTAAMRGMLLAAFTVGAADGRRLSRRSTDSIVRGAIIARAVKADGTGDLHLVIPNVQIKKGPNANFSDEAFFLSELEWVGDKTLYSPNVDWYYFIEHEDAVTTIPTVWPGTANY
jgi:hypothetical protein